MDYSREGSYHRCESDLESEYGWASSGCGDQVQARRLVCGGNVCQVQAPLILAPLVLAPLVLAPLVLAPLVLAPRLACGGNGCEALAHGRGQGNTREECKVMVAHTRAVRLEPSDNSGYGQDSGRSLPTHPTCIQVECRRKSGCEHKV